MDEEECPYLAKTEGSFYLNRRVFCDNSSCRYNSGKYIIDLEDIDAPLGICSLNGKVNSGQKNFIPLTIEKKLN